MKLISLQPFVPSGPDFNGSKQLFVDLGFTIKWDAGDYIGFEKDGCNFILQKYNNKEFAENFMVNVQVTDVELFLQQVKEKDLLAKYKIRVSEPSLMPYGKEVNLIDLAGVCWHFVQPL